MMIKEKYQQALNTLFMMSSEHLGFELNYEKNLLQELVDIYPEYLELKAKATPFKPLNQRYDNIRDIGGGDCKCNSMVYESHMFCTGCGQKLDWSEND